MRRLLPWLALTYAQEKPYYEVVFAVLTVPQHRPHRDAIRTGYGQPGGFQTKLWFVVSEKDPSFGGAGFVEERSQRDDLLVCDTAPGFDHIIGKVSCAIKKAVHLYDFDFFFKTDDDATLCIAQLVKDLRAAPKGASVYAGRRVKAGRALEAGKPLEVNLGLTTDPPHFGGHGYGVSYDVARFLSHPPAPLYHHLHEDTCFGNWVIGFDVKRLNLRAMTDHYYPNQKNLAGVSRLRGNHAVVRAHVRRRRRVDGVEPLRHRADALPRAGLGRAETGVRPDHGPALRERLGLGPLRVGLRLQAAPAQCACGEVRSDSGGGRRCAARAPRACHDARTTLIKPRRRYVKGGVLRGRTLRGRTGLSRGSEKDVREARRRRLRWKCRAMSLISPKGTRNEERPALRRRCPVAQRPAAPISRGADKIRRRARALRWRGGPLGGARVLCRVPGDAAFT